MKKRFFLILMVLALVLSACGAEKVQTVEYRGIAFTLDTENQTISRDGTVYGYEISGDSYTVIYPDGAEYTMSWSGNIGVGGGNGQYHDASHTDGDLLIDLLRKELPQEKDPARFLLCLLVIGLGVFHAAAPYAAWYLRRGWQYRDAEPSDAALALTRVGGIVLIILGLMILFI